MTAGNVTLGMGVPDRWPSEKPLFITAAVFSLLLWMVIIASMVGLVYAVLISVGVLFARAVFIAHVRGNGVRLGSDQFPELFGSVVRLSRQFGMTETPDAYLVQDGGVLNAFATKFIGTNMVILNSALIDACGDNAAARDMIIGHELGHIHAGHLRWHWFLAPAQLLPSVGKALSRAREYTCDRYGLAAAGNLDGALTGLTILAAGPKHGPRVNRQAMSRQRKEINTGWMTLAEWLSSHPPLAKRIAALDPSLNYAVPGSGSLRAGAVMVGMVLVIGGMYAAVIVPALMKRVEQTRANGAATAQTTQLEMTAEQADSILTAAATQAERSLQTGTAAGPASAAAPTDAPTGFGARTAKLFQSFRDRLP